MLLSLRDHILPCDLSQTRADLAFEVTDTCFARVMTDRLEDPIISQFHLFGVNTAVVALFRYQVPLRYLKLFAFGVAREMEYLEPILQCRRNRVQHIRSRNKEYVREVVIDVKIMIAKCI